MRFKNKWLNRVTAAVLSIGMALTPAVMNSGVTYADVKDIESPIPVTQSEEAANVLKKTVVLSGSNYDFTLEMDKSQMNLELVYDVERLLTMTINVEPYDETSSNAIMTASNAFRWTVDNEDVVEISNVTEPYSGQSIVAIHALKAGNATVTGEVTIGNVKFERTCSVIVTEPPKSYWNITLMPLFMNLNVGGVNGKLNGHVTCYTEDPEEKALFEQATYTWTSSNESVATVEGNGADAIVIPKSEGETEVKVVLNVPENLPMESSCTVVVKAKENSETPTGPEITLNKTELTLVRYDGYYDSETLEVSPKGRQYEWKTSDSEIVSVNEDGQIAVGYKAGNAVITVTDKETNKYASCKVNVIRIKSEPIPQLIEEGQEVSIDFNVQPEGIDVTQYISLISKDNNIVVFTGKSKIKGVKAGSTKIEIKRNDEIIQGFIINVIEKGKKIVAACNSFGAYLDTDCVEVKDPEGYLKSLDEDSLFDLQYEAIDKINDALNENEAIDAPTEGLDENIKLPLKDNERASVYIDSNLEEAELKAVSATKLYPTKLVFEAKPYVDIYAADSGVNNSRWEPIENKYLAGKTIRFRLPIPSVITEKYAQVLHKSEGYKDEKISDLEIKNRGTEDAYIEVPVTYFSNFEVTFTDAKVSSSSSSSSSSSGGSSRSYTYRGTKKAAQWAQDSRGWRFQNADETYVTNRWIELSWNEKSAWYRFNEQGYMVTGWFKDGDGNWYFMNDRADGTQGAMVTGWHQIAGKWYYFRVTAGGPVGSLVMNATTPDGYKVDGNGVWIQ